MKKYQTAINIQKAKEKRQFTKWQSVMSILLVGLLLPFGIYLFMGCKSKTNSEKKVVAPSADKIVTLTDAQIINAGIVTGKIEQQNISSTIKVNGKVDVPPQNLVSISVPMGGYLKSTNLLEGMHISKGQILGVVEDKQYIQLQEDYLMAKAKISYAKAEYERQKELNQSKASSDKVYQQAQTEYNLLTVLKQSYAEKLKFAGINPNNVSANNITKSINIYSPINGYVTKVNVNIGKYIMPSDVLFEIVNPADIHLALTIFEKDINNLSIGQLLNAYTNTNPEKKYPCKIILLGKNFSENRSTEIHCHFINYDKSLLPGMYMNAEIELQRQQSNALPSDAITSFESKNYIFIDKGNKQYEMTEVNTGNTENGFTEIVSATDFTDKNIVIKGAYSLLMKMKNTEE
jgi:membrane fusion protein, heavy metal efflux system